MRKLIIYPNFSMGGVTSVIRGRAAAEPENKFDVLFLHDRGGAGAFDGFPNVAVRVCAENRVANFLNYWIDRIVYDDISVLSHPKIANLLAEISEAPVTYEFHTSDLKIINQEVKALNIKELSTIAAPSEPMAEQVAALLPKKYQPRVRMISNLVDSTVFHPHGSHNFAFPVLDSRTSVIPLVWVGRFDEGKGYRYFLRLLAQLPTEYFGIVVVSLEDDPQRSAKFFAEAAAMGVAGRVRILSNLSRSSIADLYRATRDSEGWLVSTSLMESYGYSVAEALTCGLKVAAFELPAFENFKNWGALHFADIGSVKSLTALIKGRQ